MIRNKLAQMVAEVESVHSMCEGGYMYSWLVVVLCVCLFSVLLLLLDLFLTTIHMNNHSTVGFTVPI